MNFSRLFNRCVIKFLLGVIFYFTLLPVSFSTIREEDKTNTNNNKIPLETNIETNLTTILDEFSSYVKKVKEEWKIPGMAIAIVQGNNIVYTESLGERNIKHEPVTSDTIFNVASLTKSFTATLLAMQIDERKYQWVTRVLDLYPDFKLYTPKITNQFEISDLISHRSGLPETTLNELFNFGYPINHMIYALRYVKPIAPFRNSFAYQNLFLLLAQKIIEKGGGKNYAAQLQEKIFSPLEMTHSNVLSYPQLGMLENVAQPNVYFQGSNYPYIIAESSSPEKNQQEVENWYAASGGLNSSVKDLGRWLIFNMNSGRKGDVQIVSKKNMDFIHEPQTIIRKGAQGEILEAYGEGWFIDKSEFRPYTLVFHPGNNLGVHSIMAYIPDKKIGIVILTNQQPNKAPEILYKRFFDLYLNKCPMKDWNQVYLEEREKNNKTSEKHREIQACKKTKNQKLEKYAGIYYNPVYENVTIVVEGDHLVLSIGPNNTKWQLIPCNNEVFKINWPNPNGLPTPMLAEGQDTLRFLSSSTNGNINKLLIPFLHKDNMGVFKKMPAQIKSTR